MCSTDATRKLVRRKLDRIAGRIKGYATIANIVLIDKKETTSHQLQLGLLNYSTLYRICNLILIVENKFESLGQPRSLKFLL